MPSFLDGWQRPLWLLLILAIPLLYWWRSRSQRPLVMATGTLEWWRRVAEQERTAGRARRRRPPGWVLWLLAAWFAAAVGVAEWRGRGRVLEPTRWLIIDARPAAWGPAGEGAPWDGSWPETTRLELAVREVLARYDDGASWQAFDGRRVRSLKSEDFEDWLEELRAIGPASHPPAWSAWDRADAMWLVPSSEGLPRPRRAGLLVVGGAEVPGPVAREGLRWAWFEDGQVAWRPAPAWSPTQSFSDELPGLIADFARAYANAHGLADRETSSAGDATLEWRTHALPAGGAWEAEVAGARLRVAVTEPAAAAPYGAGSGSWAARHPESGAGAFLLRAGPGWISLAAGEWQILSGDPAGLALELGRMADEHWRSEPGLLPSAARRAQGPPERRQPEGSDWNAGGGKRRGAGRFTALALALAAGAAWFAASRRG